MRNHGYDESSGIPRPLSPAHDASPEPDAPHVDADHGEPAPDPRSDRPGEALQDLTVMGRMAARLAPEDRAAGIRERLLADLAEHETYARTRPLLGGLLEILDELDDLTDSASATTLSDDELGMLALTLGEIANRVTRVRAVTIAEATTRATPTAHGYHPVDWVAATDPGLTRREAQDLVTTATAVTGTDAHQWATAWDKVTAGVLSPGHAAAIISMHKECAPYADPGALAETRDLIVDHAHQWTSRELHKVLRKARTTIQPAAGLERDEQTMRASRGLWLTPRDNSPLWDLRGVLDPEGAALLHAAIGPLSAPRPTQDEAGQTIRDTRTPATRRADALLEVLTRAAAITPGQASGPSTRLLLTMDLAALTGAVNGAGIGQGDITLSPGAVRRLACDAGIIPAVLGTKSQILDLGYEARCYTPAQRLVLRQRQTTCCMTGCTVPAEWCDIHHLVEWQHGGKTDLENGTSLCGYHHARVHELGLTHTVDPDTGTVRWHLR